MIKNGIDTSLCCGLAGNPNLKDCFDENESTVDFLLQKDNILNNMYDPNSFFFSFCMKSSRKSDNTDILQVSLNAIDFPDRFTCILVVRKMNILETKIPIYNH